MSACGTYSSVVDGRACMYQLHDVSVHVRCVMSTGKGLNEFTEFAAAARSFRGRACVVRPARRCFHTRSPAPSTIMFGNCLGLPKATFSQNMHAEITCSAFRTCLLLCVGFMLDLSYMPASIRGPANACYKHQ